MTSLENCSLISFVSLFLFPAFVMMQVDQHFLNENYYYLVLFFSSRDDCAIVEIIMKIGYLFLQHVVQT